MDGRQANAESETRHDLAARPDRSHRHEEAVQQYLRAAFYSDTRREREALRDGDPRPVDEPAPQVAPVRTARDSQRRRGDRHGIPEPIRRR